MSENSESTGQSEPSELPEQSGSAAISVEVAYATPARQYLAEVKIPAGTTARQALGFSGLAVQFPQLDLQSSPIGIFGNVVTDNTVLKSGDRVEVYRPLSQDPREARRERAGAN